MTLEIISYSLETSKAFISNLCSLTREQAGNFACHFPAIIYAPAQTEFAQASSRTTQVLELEKDYLQMHRK